MKKLSLALIAALVCLCSCQGDDTNDNKKSGGEGKEEEEITDNGLGIEIDGSFEDWAAVDPTKVVSASADPDGLWDAVKQIKVCADQDFVYFYFEYDKDSVEELLEGDKLPIRLCLNVDGEFTSGYSNYFLQSYDFIIEGSVGAEGEFIDFDELARLSEDFVAGDITETVNEAAMTAAYMDVPISQKILVDVLKYKNPTYATQTKIGFK